MPLLKTKLAVDALVAKAREAKFVAFDTETTGLDWAKDKCIGASFCFDGEEGYYVQRELLGRLAPMFGDASVAKAAHNAKFDLHFLREAGITVSGVVYDTEVMARLENENRPNFKLKDIGAELYGGDAKEEQAALKQWMKDNGVESFESVPLEILAPYACKDAVLVHKVWHTLKKRLDVQDEGYSYPDGMSCLNELLDVENQVLRIAEKMELVGVPVDLPFLTEYKTRLLMQQDILSAELNHMAGETFNPESDAETAAVMLKFGWIPNEKTATGQPKLDKYALEAWDHPFSDKLSEYRRVSKLAGTYCDGIITRAKNGVLHPDFRTNGAVTGRFSCTNPNLQNVDKKSEARKAFICRPGYKNFYLDFKQIEICGFAYYAGDKIMQDTLWEGEDYHRLNAVAMYDMPAESITPEQRDKAKTFNFALLYGAGIKKIAKMLKVSEDDASMFKKRYMDRFPSVRKLRFRCEDAIRNRGFVINRFGRRRRLIADQCYKSMNALIQSWAADLLKLALVRIDEALRPFEADLLIQIHDELVIQIKDGPDQFKALKAALDAMTSVGELVSTVPIRADVKWSDTTWAEKKDLDEAALSYLSGRRLGADPAAVS